MTSNKNGKLDVVTGAFGFTGRHITRRLLEAGRTVRTLTGRSQLQGSARDPFGGQVEAIPFNFDRPAALVDGLRGADTLYNTYWIRFASGSVTFEQAVTNSGILVRAAAEAGVRRLVHISITNPSVDSPLPYFRGKALVEDAIRESGLSHAIVRPALVFGEGDILLNNIAWALRRFPLFPVPGDGRYRTQPVYVGDLAELALAAAGEPDDLVLDAVGPETYTFDELVLLVERSIGSRARLTHLHPTMAFSLSRVVGYFVRDVVLTWEEIAGLTANLLASSEPPRAGVRFSEWLTQHGKELGLEYASEMDRHYRLRPRGMLGN
jgi:NADH dehydrogenase